MPANLETSAVATGQERVSFHLNPKERQRQRLFKLQYSSSRVEAGTSGFLSIADSDRSVPAELPTPTVQAEFGASAAGSPAPCVWLVPLAPSRK